MKTAIVTDSTADLMPGDAVAELPVAASPAVTQVEDTVVIPDTEIDINAAIGARWFF
mgnify:CR=1 FL=1